MTKTVEELKAECELLTVMGLGPRPDFELNVPVHPPTFIGQDSQGNPVLCVSGEYAVSHYWLDYWGDYRGGGQWIEPILEQWARDQGMFWEWHNPAYIGLYES